MTTVQEAAASIANLGVSPTDLLALQQPTPRDKIKQRQGPGGKKLDYVTARYVMDLLDDKIGPENWQSKHTMDGAKVQCAIGIRVNGEWIWKSDGAGETDIEGEKGSFSDALKRAAVSWGIARDLYPDAASHQEAPAAAPTRPREPVNIPADPDSGFDRELREVCPVHEKPWRTNSRGKYCATKVGDGWCQEKP